MVPTLPTPPKNVCPVQAAFTSIVPCGADYSGPVVITATNNPPSLISSKQFSNRLSDQPASHSEPLSEAPCYACPKQLATADPTEAEDRASQPLTEESNHYFGDISIFPISMSIRCGLNNVGCKLFPVSRKGQALCVSRSLPYST